MGTGEHGPMRKLLTAGAVAALTALSVIPASAQTDPVRLAPCDTANPVLAPGAPIAETVDGPTIFDGETTLTYTLDLSGQQVDAVEDMKSTARVNAQLDWLVVANDYDLGLNGSVTEGFQPVDAPTEFTTANNVAHCSTVTVSVINFTATGLDPVDVSVTVSGV